VTIRGGDYGGTSTSNNEDNDEEKQQKEGPTNCYYYHENYNEHVTWIPPLHHYYPQHDNTTIIINTATTNTCTTNTTDAINMKEEDSLRFFLKEPKHMFRHMSIMAEDSPLLSHPLHFKQQQQQQKRMNRIKKRRGMSLVSSLWKWYTFQIEQRPLRTKVITAGILVGMGNVASQCIPILMKQIMMIYEKYHASSTTINNMNTTIHDTSINWYQMTEFILMGSLLQAPITHYYYLYLDEYLPPTPTPWTLTTFLKLSIDQLIFAPTFLAAVFVFLDLMDGLSCAKIWNHLTSDWCQTVIANWKLWVPSTFVNLAFCPPCFRVLFANVIFFIWSIVLSTLMHPSSSSSG
jgi:hypothetical protein